MPIWDQWTHHCSKHWRTRSTNSDHTTTNENPGIPRPADPTIRMWNPWVSYSLSTDPISCSNVGPSLHGNGAARGSARWKETPDYPTICGFHAATMGFFWLCLQASENLEACGAQHRDIRPQPTGKRDIPVGKHQRLPQRHHAEIGAHADQQLTEIADDDIRAVSAQSVARWWQSPQTTIRSPM